MEQPLHNRSRSMQRPSSRSCARQHAGSAVRLLHNSLRPPGVWRPRTCSPYSAMAFEKRMGSMMTPGSLSTAGRVRLRNDTSAGGESEDGCRVEETGRAALCTISERRASSAAALVTAPDKQTDSEQ